MTADFHQVSELSNTDPPELRHTLHHFYLQILNYGKRLCSLVYLWHFHARDSNNCLSKQILWRCKCRRRRVQRWRRRTRRTRRLRVRDIQRSGWMIWMLCVKRSQSDSPFTCFHTFSLQFRPTQLVFASFSIGILLRSPCRRCFVMWSGPWWAGLVRSNQVRWGTRPSRSSDVHFGVSSAPWTDQRLGRRPWQRQTLRDSVRRPLECGTKRKGLGNWNGFLKQESVGCGTQNAFVLQVLF